jgi:sec-independent protein translocase protein TatC
MEDLQITRDLEPNEVKVASGAGEGQVFHAITDLPESKAGDQSTESGQNTESDAVYLPALVNTAAEAQNEGDSGDDSHTMSVIEHLDELRNRILRSIGYVFVSFVATLFFTKDILRLLEAPAGNITFQALSMEEPLIVFFKVAFYVSLIVSSPLLLWELSRFVSPGLTRRERSVLAPVVIGGPILFICGALFAYGCLLPPMLHFFNSFGQGVAPINQRLDFYISLVSSILLYMGLCFQMPIIIFALAMDGVVTSSMLLKIWRYAVFGTALVACVITPDPTAFSMLIVMTALNGLYILSIIILKIAGK